MVQRKIKITPISNDRDVIYYILSECIKSDPTGITRMLPKSALYCYLIEGLTSFEANVLKQEALSVGGDLAISRNSILKRRQNEMALLLVTEKQLIRLLEKLKDQSFSGFRRLLEYFSDPRPAIWKVRGRDLVLDRPVIMGILNATPDSFSGDGVLEVKAALNRVEEMIKGGADIIDIGAESSRPGARKVSAKEEVERLAPILAAVRKEFPKVIMSVDTYKVETAKIACDLGCDVINDITGLRSPEMRRLVKKNKVGAVIMHMKGSPQTMQDNPIKKGSVGIVYQFFRKRIGLCLKEGIDEDRLVIDPGIGFGKTWQENYELIRYTSVFTSIRPVLIGASRKSLIGYLTGAKVDQRLPGTLAINLFAYSKGARIFRVHDVPEHSQAFAVWKRLVGNIQDGSSFEPTSRRQR